MSRMWTRAVVLTRCGGPCSDLIAVGAPMLRFQIDGLLTVRRPLLRCARCADEPVPADLSPLASKTIASPAAFVRVATALPLDWSARSVGDREPGEDG